MGLGLGSGLELGLGLLLGLVETSNFIITTIPMNLKFVGLVITFVPSHIPTHTGGKLPLELFPPFLQGNANMQGCGPTTLPTGADLDSAPTKIKDRLNSIGSIDLSEDAVGFKVAGDVLYTRTYTRTSACATHKNHKHAGALNDKNTQTALTNGPHQLTHRGWTILRVQPSSTSRAVTS